MAHCAGRSFGFEAQRALSLMQVRVSWQHSGILPGWGWVVNELW